ncbi:hypothetical protein PVAP13_8KG188906 [Panicum virgatum]|uniref:NB-ARC domain-containing protein n=1 Tax=Panicum virgatum TaxID=38727 RepID=A0A8T0PPJ4_PANVG|nr:hypothetical protein PVAP13_8KG188906 [Panicum virgatum]
MFLQAELRSMEGALEKISKTPADKLDNQDKIWARDPKIRRKIATGIRDIRSRVEEMSRRRDRYKVNNDAAVPVSVDTRLMAQYEKVTDLVGIDDSRDEIIQILMEGNEPSKQQSKIVSIVGFGVLGKTSLSNAVYEKLRAQFDCCAFVSVSQTPDMKNLFKCMLNDFGEKFSEKTQDEGQLIKQLREFLQDKRYE